MADATTTSSSAVLAPWSSNYVQSMLGQSSALANQPYQWYQGAMTAGDSPLQKQAYQGIGSLAVPGAVGSAAQGAGQVATQLQGAGYGTGSFNAGYNPANPAAGTTQFTNQYNPGAGQYTAQTVDNQYNATAGQYNPTTFGTDTWDTQTAQKYMNPYLQTSLNPQLDESRRQADISRMSDAARLTQAGAYGGSRQAIMESEGRRNLMDIQGQIVGRGYDTAYTQGMGQFNADEGRQLDALRGTEQSRQFGSQQGMAAAELQARYGMDAAKFNQSDRQFASQQGMTAAELQARYGLSAQEANERARQFNVGQQATQSQNAAQFQLDQQKAAEASRQFGAGYGLDALGKSLDAYKTQSQLGLAGFDAQRQGLQDQLAAGKQQQATEQAGLDAEYALWAQAQQHPYTSLEFQKSMLSGIPTVIDQRNKLDDIGRLAQILGGAKEIGDTGLFDWLKTQLPDMSNYLTPTTPTT